MEKNTLRVDLRKSGTSKEVDAVSGWTPMDVVKHLGLPVDGVIIMIGGRPAPLDSVLDDCDELEVIEVASGG